MRINNLLKKGEGQTLEFKSNSNFPFFSTINIASKVYSVKELNDMVKLNIIKRIGKGPSIKYVLVNDKVNDK